MARLMTPVALALVVLPSTAIVVAALSAALWRERTSVREGRVALLAGVALLLWAIVAAVLAYRGVFQPKDAESAPPIGVNLVVVLSFVAASLAVSESLRRLLTRQVANLIRLHLWRLVGVVFLVLMVGGQMPVLWALPAGIGDILVAVTAPWIARHVDSPGGRRRAIIWNLLGAGDLVVAVGLGIMTSPGPTHVFETTPTSELITRFPLALVPAFLVPLAFTLHVISLEQLLGSSWVRSNAEARTS